MGGNNNCCQYTVKQLNVLDGLEGKGNKPTVIAGGGSEKAS